MFGLNNNPLTHFLIKKKLDGHVLQLLQQNLVGDNKTTLKNEV